jgi:Flp pilus assembly pilin Flp
MKDRVGRERGVAAVEFALVTGLCCFLLIAGVEVGRLLFTWNAAVEATRLGARLAAVCGSADGVMVERMRRILPALQPSQVVIEDIGPTGSADGCTPEDCRAVRVSLRGVVHPTFVPWVAQVIPLPPMQTALRKEFMNSTDNEVCR